MVVTDAENDAKYRCTECNLQFGTPRDLSRHLNKTARHGGQPSPCAICHKPLTRPDSRARHERRCRERFGVTEEMWRGIERERQRGRRKSISAEGADEVGKLPGESGVNGSTACDHHPTAREACGSGSSRSRTVSVSETSDIAEPIATLESPRVASSAATPTVATRFVAQPGEPGSWTRRRSTSLRAPLAKDAPINGRKRRESSPPSRTAVPQPPPPSLPQTRPAPMTTTTTTTHWRPLNRLHPHSVRDDSPPVDPPSSPMMMHDESDGESMASVGTYRPQSRWTPLVKREDRLVELAPDGEEDEEVDELAGEEGDEPWLPSVPQHAHNHRPSHYRTQDAMMGPPPKKKLFGFEPDSTAGGVAGWHSHKTQR
ncbi:hypothetical protein BJV78DRAFT_849633 [Lactifluus subvellereus]|nr:hypothetical protein BJV78DRAFT_849633 [Lactifluus subvellereus]